MTPVITADHLTIRFGQINAVHAVSFRIDQAGSQEKVSETFHCPLPYL